MMLRMRRLKVCSKNWDWASTCTNRQMVCFIIFVVVYYIDAVVVYVNINYLIVMVRRMGAAAVVVKNSQGSMK